MPTIEASVHIERPPETVAPAFLDPANAPYWMTDLERFEVVSGRPGEIGGRAHLHYLQGGRRQVMEEVLEAHVPIDTSGRGSSGEDWKRWWKPG